MRYSVETAPESTTVTVASCVETVSVGAAASCEMPPHMPPPAKAAVENAAAANATVQNLNMPVMTRVLPSVGCDRPLQSAGGGGVSSALRIFVAFAPTARYNGGLAALGAAAGAALKTRGETIAVAESSAGGLIAAALLAVPGASAYFRGGAVIYTAAARRAYLPPGALPDGVRSASEPCAAWLAEQARSRLGADWGIVETGAAGPAGNRYGDPPGHACLAVSGPAERVLTLETGSADRAANMFAFAEAALSLLQEAMETRA